ncbi:MAG: tetratricopeptide repeat protein [Paludibaculum sp.]
MEVFEGHYDEAVRLLERSIRLDPAHGYAYNALGIALLEQVSRRPELLSRAIAAFEDAHALEPLWAYPLHNMALALAQDGRFVQAVAAYHDAMKIAPAYSYLPYNLGLLHFSLGQRNEAEQALRLALARAELRGKRAGTEKRWSEMAPPLNALGALYQSEGRSRLAERYFRKALDHNAEHVPAIHNLALWYRRKGDNTKAVEWFRKALQIDDGYTAARLGLAETLERTEHWKAAIAEYEKVVKSRKDYAAAQRALALLLVRKKEYAGALVEMRAVAAAKPAPVDAAREVEDIERLQRGEQPVTAAVRRAAAGRQP